MRIFVFWLAPIIRYAGTLLSVISFAAVSQAQTDNFDDGNDAGWIRSTNHPATYTFPTDVFGVMLIICRELQKQPDQTVLPARSASYQPNVHHFYAAVDVTSWTTNQDSDQAIGIYSRANNLADIQAGTPSGVSFNVRLHMKRAYTGPTNNGALGARDQMNLYSFLGAFGSLNLNAAMRKHSPRASPGSGGCQGTLSSDHDLHQ